MSWCIMLSACLRAAVAVSQPAVAQSSPTLRGPWLGGGLGTASARVNCELCTSDRNGGLSGYLTGGITLSPSVRLGAELAGWFDTTDDVSQRPTWTTSRSAPGTTSGRARACGSRRSPT
jgi:hypothetical protein